jgi:hypothetical protein
VVLLLLLLLVVVVVLIMVRKTLVDEDHLPDNNADISIRVILLHRRQQHVTRSIHAFPNHLKQPPNLVKQSRTQQHREYPQNTPNNISMWWRTYRIWYLGSKHGHKMGIVISRRDKTGTYWAWWFLEGTSRHELGMVVPRKYTRAQNGHGDIKGRHRGTKWAWWYLEGTHKLGIFFFSFLRTKTMIKIDQKFHSAHFI